MGSPLAFLVSSSSRRCCAYSLNFGEKILEHVLADFVPVLSFGLALHEVKLFSLASHNQLRCGYLVRRVELVLVAVSSEVSLLLRPPLQEICDFMIVFSWRGMHD